MDTCIYNSKQAIFVIIVGVHHQLCATGIAMGLLSLDLAPFLQPHLIRLQYRES